MTLTYQCKNIDFTYDLGREKFRALTSVDLTIAKGEFTCLSGPSGSGKSTLLNLLGLIEPVQSGSLVFHGTSLGELNESKKNELRRYKIGFIFQNFHLMNVLTAQENVEYFLQRQGIPREEQKQLSEHYLAKVGLADHRHKRPLEMSGGQRQRVAIARALAKRPEVIIADEPTASLDSKTGYSIIETLKNLAQEQKVTVVLSSHDPMVLANVNRVVKLADGKIIEA